MYLERRRFNGQIELIAFVVEPIPLIDALHLFPSAAVARRKVTRVSFLLR